MVDIILVVVTIVSLTCAAVMGVIVWRVLRLEQKRTEDRVAALTDAADQADIQAPAFERPGATRHRDGEHAREDGVGPDERAWSAPAPPLWTDLVMDRTRAVPAGAADDRMAAAHLFRTDEPQEGNSRRLVAGFALATMFLILAGAVLVSLSTHANAVASTEPVPPLELLSLGYVRAGGELAIRGVVRNPVGRGEMRNLVAVVFLFDKDGHYLGTLKQPVVERVLMPGTDSPFEVSVSDRLPVGRYRLTFHAGDASVPHLDRRPATAAAPEGPTRTPAAAPGSAVLSAAAAR